MTSPYAANRSALAGTAIARLLGDAPAAGIRVEEGRNGSTVLVQTPDRRWVRLHSGRDPHGEADRLVGPLFAGGEPGALIVIGLGLGYVLDALDRRSAKTRVLAIEPTPDTLVPLLQRRDWTSWLTGGRLTLLVGPDFENATAAARTLGEENAPVLAHPVLAREFPAACAKARAVAEKILAGAQSNAVARRAFAGRYLRNVLINVPAIATEGDAGRLAGAAAGVPTIVAAAGPSLDANLDDLQRYRGRALIVCVDTALRPLLAAGIKPHAVVGVDPSEINARHLTGLPPTDGIWLAGEGSLNPRVFRSFVGRTFTFKISNHHPWPWLAGLGVSRATLRAWGSVLTTAFDLACEMGGDPIVFAGADLAYTDGLLYCRNTAYEQEWSHLATPEARAEEFRDFLVQQGAYSELDVHGRQVQSRAHFVQFRDWLVARAGERPDRRILNGTGAGILHGGRIEQVRLADVPLPDGPDLDGILRARLAAAWVESSRDRSGCRTRVADAAGHPDADGVPIEAWLAFAGDTTTRAQILSCLRNAARRLSGDRRTAAGHACAAGLVAPDARLLVQGTGRAARTLKRRLVASRADIEVMGFVDGEATGTVDGLPVFPLERLDEADYDAVVTPSISPKPGSIWTLSDGSPVPCVPCDPALSAVDDAAAYLWLEDALPRIAIDKPVLVVGEGVAADRLAAAMVERHFVISINQAYARLPRADVVVLLNLQQLLKTVFSPGSDRKWRWLLVPDGLMNRFLWPTEPGAPFAPDDCAGLERQYRDAWGWDRLVTFEDVDQLVDLAWAKDRIVRYSLENVYWNRVTHPEWPGIDDTLTAFGRDQMRPNWLKSGCNPAHLAFSLLFHKGVTDVFTAGVDMDDAGTAAVMRRLGIRHRQVEGC